MTASDLFVLARWDPGLVSRARGSLTTVAGRLPAWRFRLEALGRELETAGCWTGPAATQAAAAVVSLSAAADAVTRACEDSLSAIDRLAVQAGTAAELATQAIALAAGQGIELDGGGQPTRAVAGVVAAMAPDQAAVVAARAAAAARASALAADALHAGGLAAASAVGADDALRPVGVVDAQAPASFADLAGRVGLGSPVLPSLPATRVPAAVAGWWTALDAAQQRALLAAEPGVLGGLDGLPAWARDRANRLVLARVLQDPGARSYDVAVTVAGTLAAQVAAGRTAQLLEFDAPGGLVAVGLGDVDTAGDVGVLVPGIFTTADHDLGPLLKDAADVADAAGAAGATSVATVAWLGYRTPQSLFAAAQRTDARAGGRALAGELDGVASARAADDAPEARTTVLAHSYGTVVTDEAADRPGRLAADAVVLLGSPGMGRDGAAGLEAPEVYEAAGAIDPVVGLHWFGEEPWESSYGATPLPTDWDTSHTAYYDPDHPTLAAMGAVVAGTFHPR